MKRYIVAQSLINFDKNIQVRSIWHSKLTCFLVDGGCDRSYRNLFRRFWFCKKYQVFKDNFLFAIGSQLQSGERFSNEWQPQLECFLEKCFWKDRLPGRYPGN